MPSTLIQKVSYDEKKRTLAIWFLPGGRHYEYDDVPPDVHAALRRAFSKGSFFNTHIRNAYAYREVHGGADD